MTAISYGITGITNYGDMILNSIADQEVAYQDNTSEEMARMGRRRIKFRVPVIPLI